MSRWSALKSIVSFQPTISAPAPVAELISGEGPTEVQIVTGGDVDRYEAAAVMLASYRLNKPSYPSADVATLAKGQTRLALISRCVNLIGDSAGVAPLKVYDEANDDDEILDHPMRRLMRRPNPQMGPQRFMALIAAQAALTGFCVIEKEKNNAGQVIALWPLEPARLRAVLRSQTAPAWDYAIPGQQKAYRFEPEEVIHFTWRDTLDWSPYGVGALEPAIREMALLNNMTDFLKVLFERGGVPIYGLFPKEDAAPQNQAEADAMQERFMRRRGGLANAAIPMIMADIDHVERLSMDMNELAMVAIRDLSDLAICQAFGVPAHKAGTRAGLEHTTQNATAEVEDGTFYRDTMIPFWTRLDEALSIGLLPDFLTPEQIARGNIALSFDTSDVQALQDDRNDRASWMNAAVSGGWMSVHTWSKEMGLPEPEGDDFYIRPFTIEVVPASDPLGLEAAAEEQNTAEQQPLRALPAGDDALARLQLTRALGFLGPRTREQRYAARVKIGASSKKNIALVAKKSKPKISAFFKGQSKRILSKINLEAARADREHYAAVEVDWDAEEKALEKIIRGLYHLSGETAYGAINGQLGTSISFDLANPNLKNVRELLADQVKGINDETKSIIQETITKGLDDGKTTDQIAADLQSTMDGWSSSRAQVVARTEAMQSYGYANAAGYRETKQVDRIQIFDNPDHTDDYGAEDGLTCATRDGLIAPLENAELHLRSEHPNGSEVQAPVLIGEEI